MTQSHQPQATGYLRLPQVLEIIPVSRSTWYRGIKSGIYPEPHRISTRSSAWRIHEIQDCLDRLNDH